MLVACLCAGLAFPPAFVSPSVASGTAQPSFAFNRTSYPIMMPTAMTFGPDGRLYVGTIMGDIHALTIGAGDHVVADQDITTVGSRIITGLAFDPSSTPTNMTLWVANNDPNLSGAPDDSGMVSKLTDNFSVLTNVITGLPRSNYNHMTTAIHFGPDGLLYIGEGSKTAEGAPPNVTNPVEFGTRQEELLSSAILVANVDSPTFNGNCANTAPEDPQVGTVNCDVTRYVDGARDMFDFTWAQTQTAGMQMYGPDNGNNVQGTFPSTPTAPCFGTGTVGSWKTGGDSAPGVNNDPVYHLVAGTFIGQPDPARGECVYDHGEYQHVKAPANFSAPIVNLGISPNGIFQYHGNAFGGALDGDLIVEEYADAIGEDLLALPLNANGSGLASKPFQIAAGFDHPLPIAEGPDGAIWVGEFGGTTYAGVKSNGSVDALVPVSGNTGTWTTGLGLYPQNILDAEGAAVNGKFYSCDGKTGTSKNPVHVTNCYVYDPAANTWTSIPNKPGSAVENPAAVGYNGKFYVFDGATSGTSGAVTDAYVYDPGANTWTQLAPDPVARSGATAEAMNGLIYVVGGMNGSAVSMASMDIYNPATNTWKSGPAMSTPRDNPGSAVLMDPTNTFQELYVVGGRYEKGKKESQIVNPDLNTMEIYNPNTNSWSAGPPIPTGRRAMAVGTINGMMQVVGGERTGGNSTYPENEQYNPLTQTWTELAQMLPPRQGMAFATINNVLYTAGGGLIGGTAFSNQTQSFNE